MNTITIALPESLRDAGNQYARCIGMGPEDDKTFAHEANAHDREGNRYIVTSGCDARHFADIALAQLVEPEWGCDLEAARRIHSLLRVEERASSEVVAIVLDRDIDGALELMGLIHVPSSNILTE